MTLDTETNVSILLRGKGEFRKTLDLAVEAEEQHANEPHYLGWQWFDVETHPTRLMRLVTEGIAKVNFKSNSSTCYMLKDRNGVKKALSNVEVKEGMSNA